MKGRDAGDTLASVGTARSASWPPLPVLPAWCRAIYLCEADFMVRIRELASTVRTVGPGSDQRTRIASPYPARHGANEMANNDNHNQRGGRHEQHVKTGEQSHKNDQGGSGGSQSGSSSGSRSSPGSSRGGSHEDHVRTGEQSHKND